MCKVTMGHLRVTIGHLRVIMGHLRSAIGYLVAKHKANTTELHLKVRQTCIIFRTEEKALSRKEIIESVKDSLKNLQLDYIDLLIVHKNDPNCPLEGKNLKRDKMLSG